MPAVEIRDRECDVLIIGAGLAGGCLARQLRLEQPDLKIIVVERKETFDWWVGEATIETWDDYAKRVLRLGPYLARNQIPKHGLRFWFDSPEKSLRMAEMSESGRARLTQLNPGVQLDRSTFDRDLCEINRASGVEVLLGTHVWGREQEPDDNDNITIDPVNGHVVKTSAGTIRCRYLVDAGGRSSLLARKLHLIPPEQSRNCPVGAYWARYENCRIIDELGDRAWQQRVEFTPRWASTNHFMYRGYWIWGIPVTEKIYSIGVVFHRDFHSLEMRSGDDLTSFLRQHRALDELLGPSPKALDFYGIKRLWRGATQHYSEDRWYLTGMSGHFIDPLLSTTCGSIATSNRFIAEMIASDRAGNHVRTKRLVKHFNAFFRNLYEVQVEQFRRYGNFGSFDVFVNWLFLNYNTVLNVDIPMEQADFRPLLEKIDSHGDDCGCGVGVHSDTGLIRLAGLRLADEFAAFALESDQYHSRNRGFYFEGAERPALRERVWRTDVFGEEADKHHRINWEAYVRYYVTRMCEMSGVPFDEARFRGVFQPSWTSGQTLAQIFDAMRSPTPSARAEPVTAPVVWSLKGPVDPRPEFESAFRFLGPSGEDVLRRR